MKRRAVVAMAVDVRVTAEDVAKLDEAQAAALFAGVERLARISASYSELSGVARHQERNE